MYKSNCQLLGRAGAGELGNCGIWKFTGRPFEDFFFFCKLETSADNTKKLSLQLKTKKKNLKNPNKQENPMQKTSHLPNHPSVSLVKWVLVPVWTDVCPS